MKKNLSDELNSFLKDASRVSIMGVGSDLRGDDAVGLKIIEEIKNLESSKIRIHRGSTAPENCTGEIKEFKSSHLIIIDAAQMGREPGAISVVEYNKIGGISFNTHTLPMKIIINYIKIENPCEILVIGIEPESMEFGTKLTSKIEQAKNIVVELLKTEIKMLEN